MASNDVIVRLRMLGAAAFKGAADAAAKSVRSIGTEADKTSKKGEGLRKGMAGAGGALATFAKRGAIGLAGVGTAAAIMGVKFNASMEQSTVAFTNLLGSQDKAKSMLDELYGIAAKTPFEFPQLVQSTQRLLGFGMAAKDVVPTMTAVGDAVAAAGGSGEQIDRVTTALGQMQAKGKVSSEELNQLAESGVPALKILQDELHMTGGELSSALQAGAVTAEKGIPALVKGINKRYEGMAAAQSKTFSGMLSTLKDNATQILGTVFRPLFDFLSKTVLPAVNNIADAIGKWTRGGGMTNALKDLSQGFKAGQAGIDQDFGGISRVGTVLGKVFQDVKKYFIELWNALKPMQPFITNVLLPLLKGIGKGIAASLIVTLKTLIPFIRIVATVLGWIGQKAAPLSGAFEKLGFLIGFFATGPLTKMIGVGGRVMGLIVRIALAVGRLVGVFGRLAGKIAGAVAKAFSGAIDKGKALISGFGKLGKSVIEAIANGIKDAPGLLLDALKWVVDKLPIPGFVKGKVKSALGVARAAGGVVRPGETTIVGERGPEMVRFPAGSRVMPMPSASIATPGMGGAAAGLFVAKLYLQNREIAQAVAQHTSNVMARA